MEHQLLNVCLSLLRDAGKYQEKPPSQNQGSLIFVTTNEGYVHGDEHPGHLIPSHGLGFWLPFGLSRFHQPWAT
jgi:hypothetical protein